MVEFSITEEVEVVECVPNDQLPAPLVVSIIAMVTIVVVAFRVIFIIANNIII